MKKYLLILSLLLIPLFGYLFWHASTPTLTTNLSQYQKAGDEVKSSFSSLPALPIQEEDERYTIEDTTKEGIQITYANQADTENNTALAATPDQEKPSLTLHFPKEYATDPIEVQIAEGKSILIQDKQAKGDYTAQSLSLGGSSAGLAGSTSKLESDKAKVSNNPISWLQSLLGGSTSKLEEERAYLSYTDQTKRITTYYAYGHDQATGEKQLKNWQVYTHPSIVKGEQVAYSFTNAKLKKNENGTISVYYYGDQELQNDKASAEVDPSLMARAQRTLAKEMGDSIDAGTATPNFTIPKPYYVNSTGDQVTLDWRLSMDGKDISIDFTPEANEYPIALDPTLSFTAPGQSNTGDVITGEATNNYFGYAMTTGDFNADGKIDLAIGAYGYSTNTGRAYIFYSDGNISTTSITADIVITGEATNARFGDALTAGDFNADGKIDLATGSSRYSATGRTYIFYNDGISFGTVVCTAGCLAANADAIITGEVGNNFLGATLSTGDFNADGKTDLIVGGYGYSTDTGRVYIFYNGSITTENAGGADVIITGVATSNYFGSAVTVGDLNADGKADLAISGYGCSSYSGCAYIFYNDGVSLGTAVCTTGCLAANADVIITGEGITNYFSIAITSGDFNADGRTDLVVGSNAYSSSTGRTYIFYNDGVSLGTAVCTTGCLAANADVIITGETSSNYFASSFATGDFNADGKTDLAVGAYRYSSYTGRTYIFYNDGSIPTTAATADVIITGEATGNYFGESIASGDFNADGKTDLAVGADYYSSNRGRVYIFYSQNGQVNTNQNITGNASGDNFGQAMTTGDFNADGRIDLAVGAPGYSTNTGRVYLFYGDGQIPSTATTADVTITGEATSDYFGYALTAGDFNTDGKTDLAISAQGYSSNTGRAYIFYNDGSIPSTAATADVIITGETTSDYYGVALTAGDFNADGRSDLAVGAYRYSSFTGRVYIFYNDGSIPTTAATADVIITGETTSNYFGYAMTAGDLNADGKTDLAVSAYGYTSSTGRVYIFNNDGSIPTTAATADVIITGEATNNYFGNFLTAGDLNADGTIDLVVEAQRYASFTGRVYIFYNDGSIPTTAATADVTITGEASSNFFGGKMIAGDFNADGRADLAISASGYSTQTGRIYIFYNDGVSFGTVACTTGCLASNADVILTGETTNNYFGGALTAGDFNNDGRSDLVVGAYGNATNTGRVYFYETRENFAWKLQSLSPDTGGLRTGLSGTGQELKITGNSASDQFGYAMTPGDFNADGKTDLAVGAYGYNSNTGRVYLFYNDGSLSPGASGADVIITGETTSNYFGVSLTAGDFNADGRTDLAIGAHRYSSSIGRAYIFYNDGTLPTTAATADVIITGETTDNYFGRILTVGDLNADGKTDLVVGAYRYSSYTGRAYIFYNDGSIPTTGATADVIITGEASSYFGYALTSGDLNADGKTDLAVGAFGYSTNTGRAYIFYNDGSIPTTAATADVIITGEDTSNYFGVSLTSGDLNADGKTDLAVGAYQYSTNTGRAYIFYNDGSIPTTAATADVTITGETTNNYFGQAVTVGDLNADGRTDLVVGAYGYSTNTGRAYIFYNDGSIPTTAATADVILTGETTSNYFGYALTAGDFNADGRTDLIVGAYGYASSKGRAYIYTLANDPVITGETTNNSFGTSLVSGDFNADGKIDLAVGAPGYSTNTGRVYLFYQDGTIPSGAASADVIITGETTGDYFGETFTVGDLNSDGKTDLIVGAYGYSSVTGRVYIFYNDGSIPTTAATADVIITGQGASWYFGQAMTTGDLNSDGRTDLVVSYKINVGNVYIFYNDGVSLGTTICTTGCLSTNADIIIAGEASNNNFGTSFTIGDFNSDGRSDLVVGAPGYSTNTGRAYIFYNDGVSFGTTICTTGCLAANADVIITGEVSGDRFGQSFAAGDLNADGKIDLIVGTFSGGYNSGRAYIFYNDGSIPTTAATADVIITGEVGSDNFGYAMITGDFNSDGKTDLVISGYGYNSYSGRVYTFYNDGSYPNLAASADIKTGPGETSYSFFGFAMTTGDFNADGKTDLAVGSHGYPSNTLVGRAYIFTSEAAVRESVPAIRSHGNIRMHGTFRGS